MAEVNADSSPLFDRSHSRCSRHEYTYSCYLRLSCCDIVNFEEATQNHLHSVFFGNLACAFSLLKDNLLETAVKQCNHVNGTRDILLLWVPLQSPLQLQKKWIYYLCNSSSSCNFTITHLSLLIIYHIFTAECCRRQETHVM